MPIFPTLEEDGFEFVEEPLFVWPPKRWTNGPDIHPQTGTASASLGETQSTTITTDPRANHGATIKPEWNDEDSDDAFAIPLALRPRLPGGRIQCIPSSGTTLGLPTRELPRKHPFI